MILNRLIPGTGVRGKGKMVRRCDVQWLLDHCCCVQSVVLYKEIHPPSPPPVLESHSVSNLQTYT